MEFTAVLSSKMIAQQCNCIAFYMAVTFATNIPTIVDYFVRFKIKKQFCRVMLTKIYLFSDSCAIDWNSVYR